MYIADALLKPFAWGTHDCVSFAVGWLETATGHDYLSQHRPWSNEQEAWDKIEQLGGLEHMFDINLKRIPANTARDGDLALYAKCVWIYSGPHIVSVGTNGLVHKERTLAKCAWSF
jgi:hypothetical protein